MCEARARAVVAIFWTRFLMAASDGVSRTVLRDGSLWLCGVNGF